MGYNHKDVWVTKDGREVFVGDMDDNHLLNTHRMLCNSRVDCREMRDFGCSAFAPRGEMASLDFDRMLDEMDERQSALINWISTLKEEIKMRGLEAKTPREFRPMPVPESVEHVLGGGTIIKLRKEEKSGAVE